MKLRVALRKRNDDNFVSAPVILAAQNYSINAVGGPERATISASGHPLDLLRLGQWLNYRVKIYDDAGRVLWWGRISDVEIHAGGEVTAVNLKNTWNKLAIQYQLLAAGSSGVGVSTLTAYASNTQSIATYGTRELIVQGTDIYTQAAAEAKRDQLLAYYAYPRVERVGSGSPNDNYAVLRCGSEWDVLSWKYYTNAGTTNTVTTTQISDIYTAANQYMGGIWIKNTSGVSTNQYRDGQGRALDEILQLMAIGTTNGRRLIAGVEEHRRITIYEEPARGTADWRINANGDIVDVYGSRQSPHWCSAAGHWVLYQSGYPATTNAATLADPGAFFCERATYDVTTGLTLTPRGAYSPFELVRIGIG